MSRFGKGAASLESFVRMVTGQAPKDLSLYKKALGHPNGGSKLEFQRLAWQGDALITMLATERMLRDYPDTNMGRLADLRNTVVSRFNLARVAKTIGLDKHVPVGWGAELHAEVLEAFVGAAYFDTSSVQLAKQIADRRMCEYEAFVLSQTVDIFLRIKTSVLAGKHKFKTFQSTATSVFDPNLVAVATGTGTRVAEQHAALEYMRNYGPVFMHSDKAGGGFDRRSHRTEVARAVKNSCRNSMLSFTARTLPSGGCETTATSIFDSTLSVTATADDKHSAKLAAASLYFKTHGPVFKRVEPASKPRRVTSTLSKPRRVTSTCY